MLVTIVASVFVFGLMILFHELGHFIMAKRTGITVTEFAMGFGPKLISKQYKETEYSLRIFPLGGFVKLLGEDAEEFEAQEGSFQNHPVKNRFAVIAAGPLMNFLLAVVLFSLIYFLFLGVPSVPVQIGLIVEESRAEEAGLAVGDSILTIDEEPMSSWEQIVENISANPETPLEIIIDRDGEVKEFYLVPEKEPETGKGFIGIGPKNIKFKLLPSLKLGIQNTWTFLNFIFLSIIQMLTGKIPAEIAGPVGIIQIVGEVAQTGIINLLSLAAVLSINLGLFNLLPIPALDGSRLIFLLIEAVRGKAVDPKKESFVHFVGFALLIALMIVIAYRDFIRLDLF